ncbi:MAG: glycosyltransferase family 4 protein [Planctomycetes bacterium]|nr:glycosyltransferase family 4 protein [Planctomycetota bacterium]
MRILTLGHSYVVSANQQLAYSMQQMGAERCSITIAGPSYFHGQDDLRPVSMEVSPKSPCRLVPLAAHLTSRVHFFWYGRRLKQLLQQPWDIIHCWEEPYILAGGQIAKWIPRQTPFVFRTAQSLDKRYPPPFNWIERYVVRRSAGWICSGQTVADNLISRRGYSDRPMALIPLGVDTQDFYPNRSSGEQVLANLGWSRSGPPVVGYLGRLVTPKGIQFLMDVLDGVTTPWRAIFVGSGPMEPRIRKWAASHGDRIRLCTDVSHQQVPAYLNAMDMLVAPSQTTPAWREQFGRMLIEAFATVLPVVGSDSGEIPNVIGNAGRVVGENDMPGWVSTLTELLDQPELRRTLGLAGRQRAENEYAWPIVARKHLDFFQRILDARIG